MSFIGIARAFIRSFMHQILDWKECIGPDWQFLPKKKICSSLGIRQIGTNFAKIFYHSHIPYSFNNKQYFAPTIDFEQIVYTK